MAVAFVASRRATAQLRAAADADPPLIVAMGFVAQTSFGGLDEYVQMVVDVTDGGALLTLFPNQPPFTHCALHAFHESQVFIQHTFTVFGGATDIRMTITNLRVEADGPARSEIESDGSMSFADAPMVLTGTVELFENFLLDLNVTESFSAQLVPFAAEVHESNGFVTFEATDIPVVLANINPNQLPFDVFSLTYGLAVTRVQFAGPATLIYGDSDADDDIDLSDYGDFDRCFAGQDVAIDVYCGVFDFDKDNDVDLIDWSALQAAFGTK